MCASARADVLCRSQPEDSSGPLIVTKDVLDEASMHSILCRHQPLLGCLDARRHTQQSRRRAVRWVHMTRLERITTDPDICHGQPTIRGLRYPVENLLELLASGMTIEQIVADHPDLERDDLLAALEFAALTAGGHRVVPLAAA